MAESLGMPARRSECALGVLAEGRRPGGSGRHGEALLGCLLADAEHVSDLRPGAAGGAGVVDEVPDQVVAERVQLVRGGDRSAKPRERLRRAILDVRHELLDRHQHPSMTRLTPCLCQPRVDAGPRAACRVRDPDPRARPQMSAAERAEQGAAASPQLEVEALVELERVEKAVVDRVQPPGRRGAVDLYDDLGHGDSGEAREAHRRQARTLRGVAPRGPVRSSSAERFSFGRSRADEDVSLPLGALVIVCPEPW